MYGLLREMGEEISSINLVYKNVVPVSVIPNIDDKSYIILTWIHRQLKIEKQLLPTYLVKKKLNFDTEIENCITILSLKKFIHLIYSVLHKFEEGSYKTEQKTGSPPKATGLLRW